MLEQIQGHFWNHHHILVKVIEFFFFFIWSRIFFIGGQMSKNVYFLEINVVPFENLSSSKK